MKIATVSRRRMTPRTPLRARKDKEKGRPLQIRNILIPIDFSDSSVGAIEMALPLLQRFGASLHLVHVFAPDYPLATELRREDIHAIKGRPFEEICHVARDCDINLIVMSTRGNTGLKHLALGSTAERVVRYSPCPVLVLHGVDRKKTAGAKAKGTGGPEFGKVLVPIDFSDCSMRGLAYAKALAKQFGSKLVLLNSVALQYYITSDEYARYDWPLLMEQAEKSSRNQMRELMEKTDWDGIEVESSLQVGHAGQQICARALEQKADLIVTSTHGTTGFKHILVGSTAEYVVRHATCPVLVVPSHERPTLSAARRRE